jgi:cullin 3
MGPITTQPTAKGESIELDLERLTCEDGLQLIEKQRVIPLLNYLKNDVFENNSNISFMTAYSVVVQFGDAQHDSLKLYSYYKKVICEYCEDNIALLHAQSGEELLSSLANLWEKNTILVFWMQRVFQYLDRYFTLLKGGSEFPDLFSAALQCFREVIYEKLKSKCISAMIDTISKERNGFEIDRDVLRKVTDMLCILGCALPKVVKQRSAVSGDRLWWESTVAGSKGIYTADFESALLSATSEYYRAKVVGWLAEYSCPLFLEEVKRRIEDEEQRLILYLDSSSAHELRVVTQRELILNTGATLVSMDTGCQSMFSNRKYGELTLMFNLFRREPTMLPYMTDLMEPYVEQRCRAIVNDQALIDEPPTYVEQVLDLKSELDEMVSSCFENEALFQKARNNGLENILNKDTRCAKYLALYCDVQMKKGLKGKTEDEIMRLVSRVVALLAHIKDKDIFLDFYKRALSKRLLNRLSVSDDAEDAFLARLKVECGQQAIQKHVSMFTDMRLSDELQQEYNKCSHSGSPNGIHHEVRVLQTNAWSEKVDEHNIVPCDDFVKCTDAFEAFYHSKHTGRKLRWMYSMGGAEVGSLCFPRKHIFAVSTYQALILMLFNRQNQIGFREICEATKIPVDECKRQLLSMTVSRNRILLKDALSKDIEDDSKFVVNEGFTHEKIKVSVGLIKKEEKTEITAPAEAPIERKHVVDAAIVRVMKARKRLDHNSLLEEVFRQCTLFKPQPSQIKTQIEHLIDREFLQRDPDQRNVYIYLP